MDLHVVLTIGEYAFKRVMTGWFVRILGAAAVLVFLILFQGGPDPEEALLNHRALVFDLILLTAFTIVATMGATEIPRDVESRTILILLSKPVEKSEVVLGKYLGLVYVSGFVTLVLTAATIVGCAVQDLMPDVTLVQRTFFTLFQSIVVAAMVILLSTRFNEMPIIFFTAFWTLLSMFIFYLPVLSRAEGALPLAARIVLKMVYFFFCNLQFLTIPPPDTITGSVGWAHFFLALVYALVYSAVLLMVAIHSFNRREVAG